MAVATALGDRAAAERFAHGSNRPLDAVEGGVTLLDRLGRNELTRPGSTLAEETAGYLRGVRKLARTGGEIAGTIPELLGVLAALFVELDVPPEDPRVAAMLELRSSVTDTLAALATSPPFAAVGPAIERSVLPGIRAARAGGYSARVNAVCTAYERFYDLAERELPESVIALLRRIYAFKYVRFGTSGVRGVWSKDFTEARVVATAEAIADAADLPAMSDPAPWVVGFDSREHADRVGEWVARTLAARGGPVHLSGRDAPTPAINYYGTVEIGCVPAGIVTCTSSHNPVEWHGIKFTEANGRPALSHRTNRIGARATLRLLASRGERAAPTAAGPTAGSGPIVRYDPLPTYCAWVLSAARAVPLDIAAIRAYYREKQVIVDEMHGAGRGYLPQLLRTLEVPFFVVHGLKDPRFGGLHYPLPEPPDLAESQEACRSLRATLGLAMDADADRFGAMDGDGRILHQNQVFALLVRHLLSRGLRGRVVRGLPTMTVVDRVVERSTPGDAADRPEAGEPPLYTRIAGFRMTRGALRDLPASPCYVTQVGMKYLAQAAGLAGPVGPDGRPRPPGPLLIAGEDNGGMTTGGHLYDKDGLWADLLILEMVAVHRTTLHELWRELETEVGERWTFSRLDLDGVEEVRGRLVNSLLETLAAEPDPRLAGLATRTIGGVTGELAEVRLEGDGGERARLLVRSSGTEPICRVYIEARTAERVTALGDAVLERLDRFSADAVLGAGDVWELIDVLLVTVPLPRTVDAVRSVLATLPNGTDPNGADRVRARMRARLPRLETRRRAVCERWLRLLAEPPTGR